VNTVSPRSVGLRSPTTDEVQNFQATLPGPPRAHALLQALLVFRLLPHGFLNRDLRGLLADLLGKTPNELSTSQISYNLRQLHAHGLITRIPGTHRYQITDTGSHHAMLLTHVHTRVLQPGPA
jgi:predicted MarR family transcription regulator